MATLAALQKQIAELEKKAEVIRKTEARSAAIKVKELIERYHLNADDIGMDMRAAQPRAGKVASKRGGLKRKSGGVPKFIDPASGKTWTGHGKPPYWIAGVKNRDPFLIGASESAAAPKSPNGAVPAKKRAAKKAVAKKAVAKKAAPVAENTAAE